MIVLKGIGVFSDISFGTLLIKTDINEGISKIHVNDTEQELQKYYLAKNSACEQIRSLYEEALQKFGTSEADIFATHEMMLKDKDFENTVLDIIKNQKLNAEYAVLQTSKQFSEIFLNMNDEYMRERANDVKDVSCRLINCIQGKKEIREKNIENCIISATDLTPSEVSELHKQGVKGFVLSEGSACSHASIISKVLKIPSVVALREQLKPEYNNQKVIVDGISGIVYIDPDEITIREMSKKKAQNDEQKNLLSSLKGKENITKDGIKINIFANLNSPEEIDEVLQNDSGGIGLFRSEFLYLNRNSLPTEDEQFEIYKGIVRKMGSKKVIIRTIDIGSDKRVNYLNLSKEINPAMGCRGIRLCFEHPEIFITQLCAIYRASVFGNISIMFPMIISLEEVAEIKKYIKEAKNRLSERGIEFFPNVPIGIMIETPASVFISDELAKEVDFFSIGTNDLTQYSLAIDRQNGKVNHMFNMHHKSIMRMIKMVVDNAHQNGIWVGVCGELASDESFIEKFLSIGVDELSVSPSYILSTRKKITEINISEIKDNILKNI
ncbi:MAG: phosphoenolpyruvate--protein phosphotransferase [Clostridia bacterium]|nr:phosphoenolpyruvate--protein phosphotransferase [Clostridia bacterium]